MRFPYKVVKTIVGAGVREGMMVNGLDKPGLLWTADRTRLVGDPSADTPEGMRLGFLPGSYVRAEKINCVGRGRFSR